MKLGCFPLLLIAFLAVILFGGGGEGVQDRRPEVPRTPLGGAEDVIPIPPGVPPSYAVEDPGNPRDSQGTAFAISGDGLWMTAEHVVNGCDRVGLATAQFAAERVERVFESDVSDAALIADGLPSGIALPLATRVPREGERAWHMGFPTGRPAVVQSRFIGQAAAVRGNLRGPATAILAWAEELRIPEFDHTLGGISGGPTIDSAGRVVGVNSASSDRRGRVLTTHPQQALNLVSAARQSAEPTAALTIAGPDQAAQRFEQLYAAGALRHVFCDVL